jgi:hypothetical protein
VGAVGVTGGGVTGGGVTGGGSTGGAGSGAAGTDALGHPADRGKPGRDSVIAPTLAAPVRRASAEKVSPRSRWCLCGFRPYEKSEALPHNAWMHENQRRSGRKRRAAGIGFLAFVVEALTVWARAGRPGGNILVRCRAGHVYTTIWIPGASVKSARLGPWRIQRCPVGRHWSIVTPVRESDLSPWQRRRARARHDIRVP